MRAWLALAVLVPVGIAGQQGGQAKVPEEAARLRVVTSTSARERAFDGPGECARLF